MQRPLIMVVDDDDGIREAFSEVLECEGFHVQAYRNGKEALQALKNCERPSLILLDWMMPVMNGEEFIRNESEQHLSQGAPVVVISAVADRLKPVEGVQAIVQKPLDLGKLLNTVREHCEPLQEIN
jgi:CheY-like chemotaxis protein